MTLRMNGSTSGYVELDCQATGGNNNIKLPSSNGSANQFLKNGSTAGTLGWSSMVEDSSGRVLVGTATAPTGSSSQFTKLAVQGNSTNNQAAFISLGYGQAATSLAAGANIATINFTDTAAGQFASIECTADGSTGANDYPGRIVLSTTRDGQSSPTEAARINNLGAFKATTTGSYVVPNASSHELVNGNTGEEWALRIAQSAATSNLYGQLIHFTNQSPNNATSTFFYCSDSSALRAQIRSNGGLANYQANNVNLSDINTKKDITPAADTWDCIKEWEIVNYRYKDQPDDADLNLGVIAQQVAESCPEVITVFQEAKEATETEPAQEERLGVKEQQMYWMAIKALQEAQQRIETLEASNADLAARLTALEAA